MRLLHCSKAAMSGALSISWPRRAAGSNVSMLQPRWLTWPRYLETVWSVCMVMQGQYSIRINDQWRLCFVWREDGPHEVEIVDYH